jgi:transcriptional regulator with XRE-family HTH domain
MSKKKQYYDILEIVAANVSRLRKVAGISQNILSKKAQLAHNFINDIENAKKGVSLQTLAKLSKALNVEPYQLFITPVQYPNGENQKIIGIIETLHDNINRAFEDSFKGLTKK